MKIRIQGYTKTIEELVEEIVKDKKLKTKKELEVVIRPNEDWICLCIYKNGEFITNCAC